MSNCSVNWALAVTNVLAFADEQRLATIAAGTWLARTRMSRDRSIDRWSGRPTCSTHLQSDLIIHIQTTPIVLISA